MWSYYGSKSKIAKMYPKPKYPLVIEPFAGAAWYSIHNKADNVVVNDLNKTIYGIWEWFIREASEEILYRYSNLYLGADLRLLDLPDPLRQFLGFCANRGCASPANIVQKWSCQVKRRPGWASTVNYQVMRAISLLPLVRGWTARNTNYLDMPDVEATWFIDPPYQVGGEYYPEHGLNYAELAEWVKSRKGQVIVCENSGATWLDFAPLTEIRGQRKKTSEVIWYKE